MKVYESKEAKIKASKKNKECEPRKEKEVVKKDVELEEASYKYDKELYANELDSQLPDDGNLNSPKGMLLGAGNTGRGYLRTSPTHASVGKLLDKMKRDNIKLIDKVKTKLDVNRIDSISEGQVSDLLGQCAADLNIDDDQLLSMLTKSGVKPIIWKNYIGEDGEEKEEDVSDIRIKDETAYRFLLRIAAELSVFGEKPNETYLVGVEGMDDPIEIPVPDISTDEGSTFSEERFFEAVRTYVIANRKEERKTDTGRETVKFQKNNLSVNFLSIGLESPPGFGKTTGVEAWCEKNGYTLIEYSLAGIGSEAWYGKSIPDVDTKTVQQWRTNFFDQLFNNIDKPCVVFFDEANRSDEYGRQGLMEFMRTHTLNLGAKSDFSNLDAESKSAKFGGVGEDRLNSKSDKIQGMMNWSNKGVSAEGGIDSKNWKLSADDQFYFFENIIGVVLAYNPSDSPELRSQGYKPFGDAFFDRMSTTWIEMSNEQYLPYIMDRFVGEYANLKDKLETNLGEIDTAFGKKFKRAAAANPNRKKHAGWSAAAVKKDEAETVREMSEKVVTPEDRNAILTFMQDSGLLIKKMVFTHYLLNAENDGVPVFKFTNEETYRQILKKKNEQDKAGKTIDPKGNTSPRTLEKILIGDSDWDGTGASFYRLFTQECVPEMLTEITGDDGSKVAIKKGDGEGNITNLVHQLQSDVQTLKVWCSAYDSKSNPNVNYPDLSKYNVNIGDNSAKGKETNDKLVKDRKFTDDGTVAPNSAGGMARAARGSMPK